MHSKTLILIGLASALASAQNSSTNAPLSKNNPAGAAYLATLLPGDKSTVSGVVLVRTNPVKDQPGSQISVVVAGLSPADGPYPWHIHKSPVVDGNCTTAGGHLDPYSRGDDPACDSSNPASCEVGDTSGKVGKMGMGNSTFYIIDYTDAFISTNPSSPAYIGGRSIVVHLPNKARIACANFVQIAGDKAGSGSGNGTNGEPKPSPPPLPTHNNGTTTTTTTTTPYTPRAYGPPPEATTTTTTPNLLPPHPTPSKPGNGTGCSAPKHRK